MASSRSGDDEARRQRALERRNNITVRRTTLAEADRMLGVWGDAHGEPALHGLVAIHLAARLTRAAWSLSGRPLPQYTRADTPYRFVRHPATRV